MARPMAGRQESAKGRNCIKASPKSDSYDESRLKLILRVHSHTYTRTQIQIRTQTRGTSLDSKHILFSNVVVLEHFKRKTYNNQIQTHTQTRSQTLAQTQTQNRLRAGIAEGRQSPKGSKLLRAGLTYGQDSPKGRICLRAGLA